MDLTFIDDDKPVDQQVVVKRDINCGIFFLDENRFINIIMLQKADNTKIMPVFLHVAQIFYLLGSIGVILCAGVGVILSFRTHASPPGEICLAASTTFLVLAQIIAVVCVLIQVNMYPRAEWQNLPVEDYLPNRYTYYTVLSARPLVILNWGFWIACVGTAFGLLAAIALWFHAMCSCCHLQRVRYEMLRQKPDEGSSPLIGQKAYQNMGYLRNSPQEYPAAIPPATGFRPAPQDYPPRRYEPQPSPPSDRMEFSEIGRELDL
ncbi:hypothetical protein FSP39_005255 [Pinctada imbricata]|uniref:Uncharacterized protein n=1 Tax=Pinctada imbricata TaxID=66713 RepID=A0AA89BMY5_PINIB|nr:hypothetical protein FSP39_005255 [Pinctada imbricata]